MNESQLFAHALRFASPVERAAYLDEACAGNPELRAALEALLHAHATDPGFLEKPAAPLGETADLSPSVGEVFPPTPGVIDGPGVVLAGRYKLLEAIGEGGMGTVWMAQQTEPVKRLVAVKLIKAGMDSKAVLARFEQERQALALMDHPNIAKVLDAGTAPDGRPFFVMELVKGRPITAYCDEVKLSPRQRLALFVPVCLALQHAHQKGVIHRDIKPNNVLVALYDDKPVPKVIDFGVAKATGQQLTEQTLHTGFGAVVGTPEYMSPEQASFNQLDVDTRSDVYSLGVLMYELLAGSPPFSRTELAKVGLLEILRVIREQEPPKPSTKLSTADGLASLAAKRGTEPARLTRLLRGDLDWIVMKALEKDRTRRYETANGLAADVLRYLADEAVLASPPSAAYRLRKLVRRNRGVAAAAAVVLLAVIVGVAGTVWQAVVATEERNAKQNALDDLGKEQTKTATALDQSRLQAAELAFDKGQLLGERGDTDLALLWLARALVMAPDDATDLRAAARLGLGAWRRHVNTVRQTLSHDGDVDAVAFAPDGKLVTVNDKGTTLAARWWDPTTGRSGEPLNVPWPDEMLLGLVKLSPDARFLMTCFTDKNDGITKLTDLTTGKSLWDVGKTQGRFCTAASFSPDGESVVIGYTVGGEFSLTATGEAQLFDIVTGKRLGPLLKLDRPVRASSFRRDGKGFVLACGLMSDTSEKAEARFWDLEGNETRDRLEYPSQVLSMDISPDGAWLVTGHWDRKARLWNLKDAQEPRVLQHEGTVNSVAFSRDGRNLLTGDGEGTVRYWDGAGHVIGPPLRHNGTAMNVMFSPDGKAALVGVYSSNGSRLWDLAAVGQPESTEPSFFPLAFSPDRHTLLTLDGDRTAVIRDAETRRPVGQPLSHPRPLFLHGESSLPGLRHACSSDRRWAVTLDESNVCRLWDVQTGRVVKELRPLHGDATAQPQFYGAAFSPDGKFVVVGSFKGTAFLWEAATGKHLGDVSHLPYGPVYNFAYTPGGRVFLSVGTDGATRFWDAETRVEQGSPLIQVPGFFAVDISPDGKTAVTGGTGEVLLWDVATRKRRFRLTGHSRGINDLVFSPDGRLVASASMDETARFWDVASGKPVGPPLRHPGAVDRVAFSLDGRALQTGTFNRAARSWPVPVAMTGSPEHVELWAQLMTGLELDPEGGVRILETDEWQRRRERLGGFEPTTPR